MGQNSVRLRYEKLKGYYDALSASVNEDGYSYSGIYTAASEGGASTASARTFALKLEELGCIRFYQGPKTNQNTKIGTLVKILDVPFTWELFVKHILEE